jgi:hypothetical protein
MSFLFSSVLSFWSPREDTEPKGLTTLLAPDPQNIKNDLEAQRLISTILSIHQRLTSEPDLEPRSTINSLFSHLVEISTVTVPEILTSKVIKPESRDSKP